MPKCGKRVAILKDYEKTVAFNATKTLAIGVAPEAPGLQQHHPIGAVSGVATPQDGVGDLVPHLAEEGVAEPPEAPAGPGAELGQVKAQGWVELVMGNPGMITKKI